jgi:DNA recombination protein RmuC
LTDPITLLLLAAIPALLVALVFVVAAGRRRERELERLHVLLAEQGQRLELVQRDEARAQVELAALRSALDENRRAAEEKLQLLSEAKQQLSQEFQLLAQRIFDEKSERFSQQSKTSLEGTLNPLREQLTEFRKRVEDVYDKETRDRMSLRAELGHLKELNQRMSEEALNLTRALKGDNKAQGNWGEVILERVLEESGLRKGHEYETQFAAQDEEGRRRHPDVVVRLPDNRDIVIDAKVSLLSYERYSSADTDEERQLALRAHVASVRAHVDGLSVKAYENLAGVRSLDFVLIFIPIEAAFLAAFNADPSMFRDAYEKNIIVVSPTTLLATLRTVQTIWRYERQNTNAELIARQAGALHDQFARLLESMQALGRCLEKSQQSYDETMNRFSRGKGNLVKRVHDLAKLGAKNKRNLPEALLDAAADDQLDTLADDLPEPDADNGRPVSD